MQLFILNLIIDVSKIILQLGAVAILAIFSGYLKQFEFLINNPNNDIVPTLRLIKYKIMYDQYKKNGDDDNDNEDDNSTKDADISESKKQQGPLIGHSKRTISSLIILLAIILFAAVNFFGLLISLCIQDYQKVSLHDGTLDPIQPIPLTPRPIPAGSSINGVLALMRGKDYGALDHYEIRQDHHVQIHYNTTLPIGPPTYACAGTNDGLYITPTLYQVEYVYASCNANYRPDNMIISANNIFVMNATLESLEKRSDSFVRNTVFHLPTNHADLHKLTVVNVTTHQITNQHSDVQYYLQNHSTGCHNLTAENYRTFNKPKDCTGSKSVCFPYPFDYDQLCQKDGVYERMTFSGDSKSNFFTAVLTKFTLAEVTTPYPCSDFFVNQKSLSPNDFTASGETPYAYIYSQSVKNITGWKEAYVLDTLYKEHLPLAIMNTVIGYQQSAAIPSFQTDFYLSKVGFIVLVSLLLISILLFIVSRWITPSARALATWQQWVIATNDDIHCANPHRVDYMPAMLGQVEKDHIALRVGNVIHTSQLNDISDVLNMDSKGKAKDQSLAIHQIKGATSIKID